MEGFFEGVSGGIRAYLLLILALRFKLQGTRAHQYKQRPACVWLSAAATATATAAAATAAAAAATAAAAQKTRNSFKNANVHQRGSPKMAEFVVVSLFCQIVLLNFLENFCIVLH